MLILEDSSLGGDTKIEAEYLINQVMVTPILDRKYDIIYSKVYLNKKQWDPKCELRSDPKVTGNIKKYGKCSKLKDDIKKPYTMMYFKT